MKCFQTGAVLKYFPSFEQRVILYRNFLVHCVDLPTAYWTMAALSRTSALTRPADFTNLCGCASLRAWLKPSVSFLSVRTFKRSNDPEFAEKVVDIVGLYMNPPKHAVVVSIDEKSQIQALDRMQPGLPLKPGKCGTMTHDYKRSGTTTLFAALTSPTEP